MGFIHKCLVQPFLTDSGYTVCNSSILFIGLALVIVFVIPAILRRYQITCDRHFITGTVIYAVLGSILRVFDDAQLVPAPYFVSPAIWFIGIAIALLSLLASQYAAQRTHYSYHIFWQGTGIVLIVMALASLPFTHLSRIGILFIITLLWLIPLYGVYWRQFWLFASPLSTFAIAAHLLDATSTFTAIRYFGGAEKHVVPSALIDIMDTPAIMFPLKLIVVIPAIYLITRYVPEERTYYLTAIALLGLIPAVRNIVRFLNGV